MHDNYRHTHLVFQLVYFHNFIQHNPLKVKNFFKPIKHNYKILKVKVIMQQSNPKKVNSTCCDALLELMGEFH